MLLLSALFSLQWALAQCPPVVNNSSQNESSDPPAETDTPVLPDVRTADWQYKEEKVKRSDGFQVGFGMQNVLASRIVYENEVRGKEKTVNDWSDHKNYGYVELAYRFKTDMPLTIGVNGSWTKSWNASSDFKAFSPAAPAPQNPLDPFAPVIQLHDLDWTFRQTFKTANYAVFGELDLFSLKSGFRGFVRGEIGLSHYSASSDISYKDTCGCDRKAISEYASGNIFTIGTGLGLKWEYKMIGVKAFAGYQFQQDARLSYRNDFAQWMPAFNEAGYDFKGNPARDLFSIDKPEAQLAKRNDLFYVQAGIYFNLTYRD